MFMQGRANYQRELLDAEQVAGASLEARECVRVPGRAPQDVVREAMFADLFPSGWGRPWVPPEVMASVILLQTLHGLSDSETTDAVTFDLRWKARNRLVGDRRLPRHDADVLAAQAGRQRRPEPDLLRGAAGDRADRRDQGKTRRALDSTVLDDAVATQDTVTQLIAAVRKVRREVPRCRSHRHTGDVGARLRRPGKPKIAWNDKAARDALIDGLVRDALAVLDAVRVQGEPPDGPAADAVGLLALVAGQDVELLDRDDPTTRRAGWAGRGGGSPARSRPTG